MLSFLARFGWDRERLFELTDIPFEFLRDPTSWIPAEDVEAFLRAVEQEFTDLPTSVVTEVGHMGHELRGWGVLDSVLKMMQKPQDIYSQPQRFISYFISPAPPIVNLKHRSESVSFDLPIAHNEYPATVAYLSAALEGLPRYWGKELAQVQWRNTTVQVSWSEAQSTLLSEPVANPRPELVENLVRGVEMAQAQVEARDLEIARLEQEVRELQVQLARSRKSSSEGASSTLDVSQRQQLQNFVDDIRENVLRLTDYLTRCQQALTVSRTAHRQDPQVQAVLKRIDWDTIRAQYPWLHLKIIEGLSATEQLLSPDAKPRTPLSSGIEFSDFLNGVVMRLDPAAIRHLKVNAQSFVPGMIRVDADHLHVALWQVLAAAARELNHRGTIDILGRATESQLQVIFELRADQPQKASDHLPLLTGEYLSHAGLSAAIEFIHQHNGDLKVSGGVDSQRRLTVTWPLLSQKDRSYEHNHSATLSP